MVSQRSPMKELTRSEAIVLRSLLACEDVRESERARRTGLPSRTVEEVRRRCYGEGWVFDRYVPNPVSLRTPLVSFAFARPYADKVLEVTRTFEELDGGVLLWKWPDTLFSVSWSSAPEELARQESLIAPSSNLTFNLTVDTRKAQVPVYFDFEGSWSRLTGQSGATSYPHSLPGELGPAVVLGGQERMGVTELIRRPFEGPTPGPLRVSAYFLPRSQQRLLRDGKVQRRTFLDPSAVPPYEGRSVEQIAFTHGSLKPGRSVDGLFGRLAAIHVTPFLLVSDGTHVLLGAVSPAPSPRPTDGPRPAVLANMEDFLQEIEIVRNRASDLRVIANHRYDRLIVGDGPVQPL